jgi:NAD(P)-dependent dehydrogenase (short-subunit alcohol dehydrogenase family)
MTVAIEQVWGLEGKVAIVTGGGCEGDGIGNGRAASILLARAGAHVLVVDINLGFAERTVAMIEAEGGSAVAASYNVTRAAECEALVADAMRRWGRLDGLDNNVGIGSKGTVVNETEENWHRVMTTNLDSMFLMSKYAVPAMIRSGDGGSIVNISSGAALRPSGLTAYSTSKGAVHALTQSMAVDHGPDGIRVNCVVPGAMYTPVVYSPGMSEEVRAARWQSTALQKEGTGWDIGMAVRFLLSAQSPFITGQIISVDGGTSIRSANARQLEAWPTAVRVADEN